MMAMCMKYARDEDKALQILNDGFLKVFLKINTFRGEGSFEGWIRRLVYHTMADYYKKEKTYIRFMQFELTDDRHTDTNAQDKLEFDDLVRLLDYLPDRSAEVFRLFAIEGYSHEEIGEKMSISAGTSKWHLSHARERLRLMLNTERHERTAQL